MTAPPRLASLATAVPPHRVRQEDARDLAVALFADVIGDDRRLIDVFANAAIRTRHLCMPLEWFARDHGFAERNALYVEHALTLAERATRDALDRAHLHPVDVDHIVFLSSTGLATPSLDARLVNSLGLRPDVQRTPVWGLGCAGGAAGLARARQIALADPGARVLLIALELCSLTFQRNDLSRRNFVASSLFADGAAAAVVAGPAADVPRHGVRTLSLLGGGSHLWADTLDVMGWEIDERGLHVVFSRDIPAFVRERVRSALETFLGSHGLTLDSIRHWVAHPGGAKVLDAWAEALDRPASTFDHAREVLAGHGNMSSPSCLFVLERFLATDTIGRDELAVVAALGPGFSCELVLARGDDA